MLFRSYSCATLNCSEEETLSHLFWSYPFADQCWNYICLQRNTNLSVFEAIDDMKKKIQKPFAMEIIILAAWSIWIIRNNKVFKNQHPSFQSWKIIFLQELHLVSFRMKKKHSETFKEWLQSQT